MEKPKINLILASGSPRRKELLGHLNLPFQIMTSNVEEFSNSADPVIYASDIARLKGHSILEKVKNELSNHLIVSADTIVVFKDKIYGKPQNRDEAQIFLSELAGNTHSVFTAVSIILCHNKKISETSFVDESRVSFNAISMELMQNYLDTGDSLDKAGAYGIQGPSLTFISKVEGSYSNVVGFPLSRFVEECQDFFKKHFPQEASWFSLLRS